LGIKENDKIQKIGIMKKFKKTMTKIVKTIRKKLGENSLSSTNLMVIVGVMGPFNVSASLGNCFSLTPCNTYLQHWSWLLVTL
jgi:hypothetical protein